MNTQSYKTQSAKKHEVERKWWILDAEGQTLGRISSKIASVLKGKHKPSYTAHVDTGDYVVVINAAKVKMSGNKMQQKVYHAYSGYPGGLKSISADDLMKRKPTRLVERAVKGMLPNNKLGNQMFRKLFVYGADEHPHAANKPENLSL